MQLTSKIRLRLRGGVRLVKGVNVIAEPVSPPLRRMLEKLAKRGYITLGQDSGPSDPSAQHSAPIKADHVALSPPSPNGASAAPAVVIPEAMCAACPVLPPAEPGALIPCLACFERAGYTADAYARRWPEHAPKGNTEDPQAPRVASGAIQNLYVEGRVVVDDERKGELVQREDTMPLVLDPEAASEVATEPIDEPKKRRSRPTKQAT